MRPGVIWIVLCALSRPIARYEAPMLKSTSGDYETAARELELLVKDDPDWLEPHVEPRDLVLSAAPTRGRRKRAPDCGQPDGQTAASRPGK